MSAGYETLTDKEKETLRLIVRGHDAKSMAQELDLSVHTINERLRAARRKLSVTSSREAARIAFKQEETHPQFSGPKSFGDALNLADRNQPGFGHYARWLIGGLVMSLFAAFLFLSSPFVDEQVEYRPAEVVANDAAIESAAREWLELVDMGDWQASYEATASSFRELNTTENWESASLQAREPLGEVLSREAITVQNIPAPPAGLQLIRFKTDFAATGFETETLTLQREEGEFKVVGYYID